MGRFISEDPIGFGGGTNFYAYTGDTPLNFIDPFGYTPMWPGSGNWGGIPFPGGGGNNGGAGGGSGGGAGSGGGGGAGSGGGGGCSLPGRKDGGGNGADNKCNLPPKHPCSELEKMFYAWHHVDTYLEVPLGVGLAVTGVLGEGAAWATGGPLLGVPALPGAAAAVYDGYKIATSSWEELQEPNNPDFGLDCE